MNTRRAIACSAFALLALFLTAQPSTAAMCAHWASPQPVVVGSTAKVGFETFAVNARGDGYTLAPHAFRDYRFDISAVSPGGGEIPVEVRPSEATDEWSGSFVPDQAGVWRLTIKNLAGISDAVCYSDVVLMVHEEDQPERWGLIALVAALVIILAASSVAIALRRRKSLLS